MNIRLRLSQIIEARATQLIIIALIVLNAIVLALETSASIAVSYTHLTLPTTPYV